MESLFLHILFSWSHFGLFIVLLAAGLGLPLPEDIPLILAGLVVSHTKGSLLLMMVTGVAGVMAGDTALFFMGRRYGTDVVQHRWFRSIAKPWLLEKARRKYEEHGAKILFTARFMPGLRAVIFLTAGVFRVPYWKFLTFDGCAALISVPLWIWAGWHFSGKIGEVFASARIATYTILGVLALALIVWVIWEYTHNLRNKNREEQAAADSPSGVIQEASAALTSSNSQDDSPEPTEANHSAPAPVDKVIIDPPKVPSKIE